MLFRVKYLYECNVITAKNYPYILETITNIVDKSNIILGLVLKNRVTNNSAYHKRIWYYLNELSILEKMLLNLAR